jgi:hypothetical protein
MEKSAAIVNEDNENQIKMFKEINLKDGDTETANAIKIQEQNMEPLQALQKKQRAGTTITFLPKIKASKGEKGTPDVTFEPELLDVIYSKVSEARLAASCTAQNMDYGKDSEHQQISLGNW